MPKRDAGHMRTQRERILRAAIECVGTLGIERTSVAAIRQRAGLSAGALYTHFASKEDIVAAALRLGGAEDDGGMPDDWPGCRDWVSITAEAPGFDFPTVASIQLQLFASSTRPGALHDMLQPMIERSLDAVVRHLTAMERGGRVRLRLSPLQTALAISALKDGLAWTALARDRPLSEVGRDLAAALDCLVDRSPTGSEPPQVAGPGS